MFACKRVKVPPRAHRFRYVSDMTNTAKRDAVRQINRDINHAQHQLKVASARNPPRGRMSETQAVSKLQAFLRDRRARAINARPAPSTSRQFRGQAYARPGPPRTNVRTSHTRGERGGNSWRQNVANPFSLDVAKYPGLDIGPLSNAIGTLDITTTDSPLPTGVTSYQGQSIVIQWAPGLCMPASKENWPHERAQTSLTSIMGMWASLTENGTVCNAQGIFAEKFKGMGSDVKKTRLLKAGIQAHVQQPRAATGGYCYLNKGPDALLCLGGPNFSGTPPVYTPATQFNPLITGQLAYINKHDGTFVVATKANLASFATETAMTISEKLCDHDDFPLVSTPYDAVKAADFKPYDQRNSQMSPLGPYPGGFDTALADPIWNPGWMIFQPTFLTSTAPDKIVANIQLHTWTAWEILPFAGTYAHLSRTDAVQASSMQQMQTPKPAQLNDFFGALRRGAEWGVNHIPQIVGGARQAFGAAQKAYQAIGGAAPLMMAL